MRFASTLHCAYVAAMMGVGQLLLENLACQRGGRELFSGLNLALGQGDAAVTIGPNGVGKSSLLRLCAGLLMAQSGRVEALGGVALADDRLALDMDQPLARALGFWARVDGRGGAVPEALEAFGINHLGEVPVRMLSTGQRKRATLARVAASGAGVWLLDEPANGLDVDGLVFLERALAQHRAAGGVVLAASHQPIGLDDPQTVSLGAA
jgi:heme exporter protein A